jgi:hypothetical protein
VDTAEHELILRVVERAQRALGRGATAVDVLTHCTPSERSELPDSPLGFTRLASRYTHTRGSLGRCLRQRTLRGRTLHECYASTAFELGFAETAHLYQVWLELQSELQRRSPADFEAAREAAARAWDVRCDERSFPCPWSNRPIAAGPEEKQ